MRFREIPGPAKPMHYRHQDEPAEEQNADACRKTSSGLSTATSEEQHEGSTIGRTSFQRFFITLPRIARPRRICQPDSQTPLSLLGFELAACRRRAYLVRFRIGGGGIEKAQYRVKIGLKCGKQELFEYPAVQWSFAPVSASALPGV